MRVAKASVASSSCSAGTERLARPHSAAFVPVIVSPVNMSCLARMAPRRYVHMDVVGHPQTRVGIYPIFASSDMITMSQHNAISLPPATAYPCTLAIVGLEHLHSAMKSSVLRFIKA